MRFSRFWAMPSHETFSILPIRELIARYCIDAEVVIDPFARNSSITSLSNDHDPDTSAHYHLDARDFLAQMASDGIRADLVLCDPPYSPRQISEHYKRLGLPCSIETTQHSLFRSQVGCAIDSVVKYGGVVISLGWDSNGVGLAERYDTEEIMLVAHGAGHHDTIVTVQRKLQAGLFTFRRRSEV